MKKRVYKKHKCLDCDNLCGQGYSYCKPCGYKHKTRPSGLKYKIKVVNKSWFPKGHIPWSAGTKGLVKPNSGNFKKGVRSNIKGEFKPNQTRAEKNNKWVGDEVGYFQLHRWVNSNYEWGKICEHCGEGDKRLELASRNYKYTREKGDWIKLCKKCHVKFDKENNMWGSATKRFNF